jgi:catechol 2,3-dioxygenase-like lactoylglutathione lyase family enzyme
MSAALTHGQILGGIVTVPNLEASLCDYQGKLGLTLVEQGNVPADLAASWGCPGVTGARMATLQPTSGAHCFIRLVEQPLQPDFVPTTSYGWAAYEITVQDVFGWPEKITGSGFDIIGPPREIAGLPYFVAMQVHGRGREMLYFNEVRENTPSSDLPKAQSPMDHIFIIILAAKDRTASVKWYCDKIGLDQADTYTIDYTMINKAFGLPTGSKTSLTMIQSNRMPIFEIDDYPAQAVTRPQLKGLLPPGNALVTLAVSAFERLALDWITPPTIRNEPIYGVRKCATTLGPSGELLELIEIG